MSGFLKAIQNIVPSPALPALKSAYRRSQQALAEMRVSAELRKLTTGRDSIIVGPWLSEVGYELLYWIPFLHAVLDRFPILADRLVVLSRGGVKEWYRSVSNRYLDIFELLPLESYRARNHRRSMDSGLKQFALSDFDQEIFRSALAHLGVSKSKVLHPSLMFNLFRSFWDERSSVALIQKYTRFEKLSESSGVTGKATPGLPANYAAVRFYFNNVFPDRPETRAFQTAIIKQIAQEIDVVVLNTELEVDDHEDMDNLNHPRVHSSAHLMQAKDNLSVQTEIVRKAKVYVGTYGGLSYLPLLCGTPTVAFHWQEGPYFSRHGQIVRTALSHLGTPFQNICIQDAASQAAMADIISALRPALVGA